MLEENMNQNQTPPQQPASQTNQTQNKNWLPDDMDEIQLHARQVAQTNTAWQKEKHQEIKDLRDFANSPEVFGQDGTMALELGMRNLGMPGIASSGRALDQLDKREEAMIEERSLREQDKSYLTLNDKAKQAAEARIYNGYNFRRDWQGIYDYSQINHQKFEAMPTTPLSKGIKRGLEIMLGNEIRLAAARDSRLGLDYKDHRKISEISSKMANDPGFIRFLNGEKNYFPNTTNIKFEIKKRIQNNEAT